MRNTRLAILALAGFILATSAVNAANECRHNVCSYDASAVRMENGWKANLKLGITASLYEFMNVRIAGHSQLEVDGPGNNVSLSLDVPANWDGTFGAQACIDDRPIETRCDPWQTFHVELPLATDDRNFCVRYAGHATSTATAAQQGSCAFSVPPGRWSTDNAFHLKWCVDQFRAAGFDAGRLAAARNLANSEDAARIDALKVCQAAVAAATPPKCPDGQIFSENENQCVIPPPPGAGGALQMSCKSGPGMSGTQEARGLLITFAAPSNPEAGMPGPGECIITDRPLLPSEPRKLLMPPVESSNARLLAEAVNGGTFQLHVTTREDAFRVTSIDGVQVMGGVLSAGPVDAVPAPAPGGGGLTASTCGLSGTATVVIPDPNLTTLNVRDKPNGNILPTKLPENTQVNVVGGCGVQLSAGIVAQQPGQVIPGWCAISSPVIGCVAEQFLVAGIPAGGQVGLPPGSAGIVANPPQTIPQPQPQVGAPPPVVTVPAAGGGQVARLTQGANIRNAASGSAKAKTGSSLPGGTIVTVLECVPSWCRIALPQFPVAWVSRDFLAFDFAGAPAPASVDVTINIGGGGVAPAPVQPPAPPATGGGGLTASTCGLPGGTATVVIPDPKITTLNVRDKPSGSILTKIPENTQVTVVGGCGVQLSAGIVAQTPGAGGQAPVPGWCAISSPVIGCVSEQFLVAGIPAGGPVGAGSAGLVANPPQAAPAPTFTGTWSAEAQGSGYTFTLNQNGNTVSGNYSGGDGSNGQLNGSVSGNVLRFTWQQTDGVSGAGKFALSGDGNSFDGSYTLGSDPDVAEGSWNGTRQ